jgi:hypothetical protein
MTFTPKRLLRLFPGLWRVRYGDEFLALLETTPVTRDVVLDVMRAASREWIGHTRIGRLFLGCIVAEAATLVAYGMSRLVPPTAFFGDHRMDSLSGIVLVGFSGLAPLLVGSLLIILRTRHDRRFAWLGLPYQLAALFGAAAWSQWVGFGWHVVGYAVPELTWNAAAGCALLVTWMLLLLFNVDRSRESYFPWRGPAAWVGSDRY